VDTKGQNSTNSASNNVPFQNAVVKIVAINLNHKVGGLILDFVSSEVKQSSLNRLYLYD
jgi:hypothetical protein